MTGAWLAKIRAAQLQRTERLCGQTVTRIPFGLEPGCDGEGLARTAPCRDCAVSPGQLHVPGCCIEACGRCGAQRLSCLCTDPLPVRQRRRRMGGGV